MSFLLILSHFRSFLLYLSLLLIIFTIFSDHQNPDPAHNLLKCMHCRVQYDTHKPVVSRTCKMMCPSLGRHLIRRDMQCNNIFKCCLPLIPTLHAWTRRHPEGLVLLDDEYCMRGKQCWPLLITLSLCRVNWTDRVNRSALSIFIYHEHHHLLSL